MGLELLDQCPFVQAILIPTSGGGLAGGIATAVKGINKDIKSKILNAIHLFKIWWTLIGVFPVCFG